MEDFKVIERMDYMCAESLDPEMYGSFCEIKDALLKTRKSLKHYFTTAEKGGRFCDICGQYITDDLHHRGRKEGE